MWSRCDRDRADTGEQRLSERFSSDSTQHSAEDLNEHDECPASVQPCPARSRDDRAIEALENGKTLNPGCFTIYLGEHFREKLFLRRYPLVHIYRAHPVCGEVQSTESDYMLTWSIGRAAASAGRPLLCRLSAASRPPGCRRPARRIN